ncbi:MAG: DUF885 domain-containing protein [Taibaiella sp.]|nr:DUF885 domain-containing protein [Taibaiella sp.]
MKKLILLILVAGTLSACHNQNAETPAQKKDNGFNALLDQYWEERMQLFPLEATGYGDNRYNDRLTITIAESFRDSLKRFYQAYLDRAQQIDTTTLKDEEKVTYSLFRYEMQMGIEGLKYPTHYLPINQFWAFTLNLPVLGSGKGNQPFKTVKDYDNFLKRIDLLPAWTDTAIYNMRKGIKAGWVLPKVLVIKILPQLKAMMVTNAAKSIFYQPVDSMPGSFDTNDKQRLTAAYKNAIDSIIIPAYGKLYHFFESEYLPAARTSAGIGDLPGGKEYYQYCIKSWTTTDMTPDSIYQTGLAEVARLGSEMAQVKNATGYTGDMRSFFEYLNKDKKFYPFTTAQQVIDSFWNIKKQEDPQLKKLFAHTPKSPFTIRQTEAFREASASAEYNQPSEDGSRPGIFYVPIPNAKKFNAAGMETLFLHEAVPGHHYQISLQQENKQLPKFRRFLWYGAYGEGWALYSESLGKELGVYKNPYQYFGHLSDAMHRAIRLVVDVGMHSRGMSREDAIKYMMANERATEAEATAEIERYMAIPGQALSYKIGQMAITAARKKQENEMGSNFNIAAFHDQVLNDGCLPLNLLTQKLDKWANKNKK